MTFTYDGSGEWISDCGNYTIWIQSHPRHEPAYWAASFRNEKPWLVDNETKAGAKRACKAHRDAGVTHQEEK